MRRRFNNLTVRKSPTAKKDGGKHHHQTAEQQEASLRSFRLASLIFLLMMIAWGVAMTVFLTMIAFRYMFNTIDDDRAWYAAEGSGRRAAAEVTRTLSSAIEARQNMRMALCRGLIAGPADSAALERVLAPVLLSRSSSLRSVELAFSVSTAQIVVTRGRASDGNWVAIVKSTAKDCYLLGLEGCLDKAKNTEWKKAAMALAEEATLYPKQNDWPCPGTNNESTTEAIAWEEAPQILQQNLDADAYKSKDLTAWFPSYRFLFRTGFRYDEGKSEEKSIVVGRAVVELGELSGGKLQDEMLGEGGRVFLCDAAGVVLASRDLSEMLELEGDASGPRKVTLRKIWGVGPWGAGLRSAFKGDSVDKVRHMHDSFSVVVVPLSEPHSNFAIVAMTENRAAFTNYLLYTMSIMSLGLAGFPYAAGIITGMLIMLRQWMRIIGNKESLTKSTTEPEAEDNEHADELRADLENAKRPSVVSIASVFAPGFKRVRASLAVRFRGGGSEPVPKGAPTKHGAAAVAALPAIEGAGPTASPTT